MTETVQRVVIKCRISNLFILININDETLFPVRLFCEGMVAACFITAVFAFLFFGVVYTLKYFNQWARAQNQYQGESQVIFDSISYSFLSLYFSIFPSCICS